jgi:pimeloyl-ACP methyl ester carboxylesterase
LEIRRDFCQYILLTDSRRLAYCDYGPLTGFPVFYFHGTPGSRLEAQLADQAARQHDIRLLALDRPGIGRSDLQPGRKLLDWPQDMAATADQLGLDRFGVIGFSGGGPYALACAYALPERLNFVALVGSWAPVAAESELWAAMAPLDRFFGRLSRRAP